ncbi:MAG: phospho-sugar mutase [Alistipes sp.]|nr:phospho-sugar mutase [Candidatus Minthomonas equi]
MNYREIALQWTGPQYDEKTRMKVNSMLHGDPKELEDAFYRNLEFGTGGLRGIMGVGINRMNRYTVGMATQGFSNYIKKAFPAGGVKVAVSYDSRNHSKEFAKITAEVFAANGFHVYLFENIRPTPVLSFAIRELKCQAGVMITASHNPKEYNGYKAYWSDGAQITSPHDTEIIEEVKKITDPSMVNFSGEQATRIELIGEDIDRRYLESIHSLMLSPDSVKRHSDMKMVYTPLHGCGVRLVPRSLKELGFTNVHTVADQEISDGDFPTVVSPNPEEPGAMKMSVELAEKIGADFAMASDPDADRVGIAVRDNDGKMVLFNGNQTASMLMYYMLTRWSELGKIENAPYVVTTIVSSQLMHAIAAKYGVQIYDVLTGFKYIAEIVRNNEGKRIFICGAEESYGFNAGEFVRDKDSVVTCSLIAECAAWAADQGLTLYQLMDKIYAEFGLYRERLVSVVRKGKDGVEQIQNMMKEYRENPPSVIAGSKVTKIIDYNEPEKTGLPKSNVLRFFTADGGVVAVRPSGTEPKIKFYFGAKGENANDTLDQMVNEFSK